MMGVIVLWLVLWIAIVFAIMPKQHKANMEHEQFLVITLIITILTINY